jgi:hypothetical protein
LWATPAGRYWVYKDAATIWDVKISIPELKDLAEQHARADGAAGSIEGIKRRYDFENAVDDGIPLNFLGGDSTGIDELVGRYQLPVSDSKGWKTIPNDSVERVWTRARAKTEEVVKMQKG